MLNRTVMIVTVLGLALCAVSLKSLFDALRYVPYEDRPVGEHTLTGEWVGPSTAPSGQSYFMFLSLSRNTEEGAVGRTDACKAAGWCISLSGNAVFCDGSGKPVQYEVYVDAEVIGPKRIDLEFLPREGILDLGPQPLHALWRGGDELELIGAGPKRDGSGSERSLGRNFDAALRRKNTKQAHDCREAADDRDIP